MKIIKDKLNIGFAIALAGLPIIMSMVDIFGLYLALPYYVVIWGIGYGVCLLLGILSYILRGYRFEFKALKNPYGAISICMFLWIMLTSVINRGFNIYLLMYLTYFLIFICIFILNSKWKKYIINTLLLTIAVSCLMGFVYMYTKAMPGLDNEGFYIALHFANPNYSSHIVGALALVCFIQFDKAQSKFWNAFYSVIYIIYATHLFVNGSFAAITFLILVEVGVQIFVGIKTKKFRHKMLVLSVVLLPICLLTELLPNIEIIRTCRYNYLLECVAVFDNIFGTDLLSKFGIEKIIGSDGWNRQELIAISWKQITSSPKNFIFGGGAGLFYKYLPHNGILSLALDFGMMFPVMFMSLLAYLIIKIVKTKVSLTKLNFLPAIICFLMCYITGSIVPNSFYVFMIIFALLFGQLVEENKEI